MHILQAIKELGFNPHKLNAFEGVQQTEIYLQSIDRIMKMKDVQVNISNYPDPGKIFQRARCLQTRQPGMPHPFVAPDDFQNWLKELKANAEKKLEEERAKEKKIIV